MKKQKIESEDFSKSNATEDKKTKKKSSAQKAMPIMIITIVSLVVILTCVLIAYYQVYKSGKQNANILEGIYASSYYSMVDNVNNLSVDVSKYSNLTTNQAKLSTMQDIMSDCNYILAGLSTLPINQENVVASTRFFNQINGLCESYLKILNKNQNLTKEQELVFDEIALVVGKIKENFNKQNYGMYDTGFSFVDATIFDRTGMNELSSSLGNLTSSEIDYPTMIFDGPFSASLETKQVKGLPSNEIEKSDAESYLNDVVFKNRDAKIEFDKETNGDIKTFDFNVEIEGEKFYAQVSKRGGLLITLSGNATEADPIMKEEQAKEMAKTFANNIGFENMNYVWQETHGNVSYINLAPVVNDVIYYPDLVKVKIDLTSQNIVGFEAVNYALNHIERNPEFLITETEAEDLLGFDYEIQKTEKAVIRLDGGEEISAYEFFVERIDGYYFYYINATTNQISKILKLVTIKGVEKLI